jgi:K+-transporting ATPase A subunit
MRLFDLTALARRLVRVVAGAIAWTLVGAAIGSAGGVVYGTAFGVLYGMLHGTLANPLPIGLGFAAAGALAGALLGAFRGLIECDCSRPKSQGLEWAAASDEKRVAIKQFGTNGGGFCDANSTHPFSDSPSSLPSPVRRMR